MKRADGVIVRACSSFARRTGALINGLAVLWMASAPGAAWGQWTGGPAGPISYNGGSVGIGTTSPTRLLELSGANEPLVQVTHTGMPGSPFLLMGMNAGNNAALFQASNGKDFKFYNGQYALTILGSNGNVGVGTMAPQYKLAVNGTIGAQDVIVTNTGWSDYVFRPGYRLRPLREVGAHIQAHHRLPDIPSEAEVKEKGVSVGEMQAKLLAKIEELTLHLIQPDKENRELRERVAQLENRAAVAGQ